MDQSKAVEAPAAQLPSIMTLGKRTALILQRLSGCGLSWPVLVHCVSVGPTSTPVHSRNSNPNVLMMQPTENRNRDDAADGLRTTEIGRVFI